MVPTGPITTRFTGYAGFVTMLLLALWLGGAANAWVTMGAVQRAAASLRLWSSRRPYVRAGVAG
ncbi:MAG: hypothetical protein ABSC16_03230 [Candidatus Dormibacteria bacterium]|jgi:hypothetical protein|nr:hypothetical protein [Chloroflexota bacterium]HBV95092.1 hypothetical protein [Chloroflexota bacterium]